MNKFNDRQKETFDGVVEVSHENGQLKEKGNYKDGKQNGLYESFDENGQLKHRGNYKNGAEDGLWEEFDESGQLKHRGNHKNGALEGLWETFYLSNSNPFILHGPIQTRGYYKNGELIISVIYFDENGQLKR